MAHAPGLSADTQPHYPLTPTALLLPTIKHPIEIAAYETATPLIPRLWITAAFGSISTGFAQQLNAEGITIKRETLDDAHLEELANMVLLGRRRAYARPPDSPAVTIRKTIGGSTQKVLHFLRRIVLPDDTEQSEEGRIGD